MNFREFVNEDKRRPYKELEPTHEDVDVQDEYNEDNDDVEDVEDDEPESPVVTPTRVQGRVQRIVQKMPQRRIDQRESRLRQQSWVARPAMPVEQYDRPIQINKRQLSEDTIEGTANSLTEALKRKVDTVFYRFGIQGLEKLDEKILDTIEELQYPEVKQTKKPGANMRRVPPKRIPRKNKPIQLEKVETTRARGFEQVRHGNPVPEQTAVVEEPRRVTEQNPSLMGSILEGMGNSVGEIAEQLLAGEPKGQPAVEVEEPSRVTEQNPPSLESILEGMGNSVGEMAEHLLEAEPKGQPAVEVEEPQQKPSETIVDLTEDAQTPEAPVEQNEVESEPTVEKPKRTRKSKKEETSSEE